MQIQVSMGKWQNYISKTHCLPLCQPYFKENLWEFKKVESQKAAFSGYCSMLLSGAHFPVSKSVGCWILTSKPPLKNYPHTNFPCSSGMAHIQHHRMVTKAWPPCLSSGHLWGAIQFQSYAQASWSLSCITVPRLILPSSALHGCCPQEPSQ